ncbi:hypothetical protein COT44_04445 [Candidatus Shapirobacteria bacterium CG08_land_8_20_14_0_20_39_18]|uniref:UPF0102 protein COT44_04445 n=1 Tax=Candidatus Shapirobacteria bacterium CG08_land_8_20_14_0_20_39_18 TaxID=1974883 RepID=A0A2M6XBW1_9BACT|nr:MAG: hypothetical protein COT44_04445 [Candidatus Shapirobacteria bacterium CG08_land_8_20_14_0_20_39_18]PIY65308.1 MAG: hypothetical protein COY91_02735 [Candidatus Shapirobacteria bacterium CG_4_10_14_0_8_um_filter_39_15]
MSSKDLGGRGESLAVDILRKQGYKILQRNFSCKIGEIDIIALDDNVLIFVEVKTRSNSWYGLPEEAITPWKIRKIARVGDYYKLLHPELPEQLRIDAVCIDYNETRVIKNISPL